MLGTYYTGDLAPINDARTRDYEAQTRRMGVDQAYMLGLLQGVNQGRQVSVNDKQVETGGLLGGLNYRLGQDQVGARNRETDVRERLGLDTLAFNRDQAAVENALRSTELSDRDRQFESSLTNAAAARTAYLQSGVGDGVAAPGVQIELLRRKQERDAMVRAAVDAARKINDALDESIYNDAKWDMTEDPKDIEKAIKGGDLGKRAKHRKIVSATLTQLGPEISALINIDPTTLRASPIDIPDVVGAGQPQGPGGGIVQPIPAPPARRAMLNNFLGGQFDPNRLLRE